jgi:hypothetical protein
MQCTNNLKRIGLAPHNDHAAFECFPPGRMAPHHGNSEHGAGRCWRGNIAVHVHIAPFLDDAKLFDAFNFGAAYIDPPECARNLTVSMVRSALFVRPSMAKDPGNVPVNNTTSMTRRTAGRHTCPEGSDGFVTSSAAPMAPGGSDRVCRAGHAPAGMTPHYHD